MRGLCDMFVCMGCARECVSDGEHCRGHDSESSRLCFGGAPAAVTLWSVKQNSGRSSRPLEHRSTVVDPCRGAAKGVYYRRARRRTQRCERSCLRQGPPPGTSGAHSPSAMIPTRRLPRRTALRVFLLSDSFTLRLQADKGRHALQLLRSIPFRGHGVNS